MALDRAREAVNRPPALSTALAHLAAGDGALAVIELLALRSTQPAVLTSADAHYWLGLSYLQAFDWPAAAGELRAYLAVDHAGWRVGWAYLHLGRACEQAGRDDEASLAYRGCLAVEGSERAARKLAFDLMSRIASELPMGYGQAATRPVEPKKKRGLFW